MTRNMSEPGRLEPPGITCLILVWPRFSSSSRFGCFGPHGPRSPPLCLFGAIGFVPCFSLPRDGPIPCAFDAALELVCSVVGHLCCLDVGMPRTLRGRRKKCQSKPPHGRGLASKCHAGVDVSVRATSTIVLGKLGRG